MFVEQISADCDSLNDARIIDDARAIVACASRGPASVMHLAWGRLLREIPDDSDNSIGADLRNSNFLCVDESADSKKLAVGTAGGRSINVVRFAADSSMLVSGGEDGAISLWDLSHADASTELDRHYGVIRGLEFSPDSRRLAVVAADGSATLLDADNWAEKARIETSRPWHGVAWTRDSNRLALGDTKGRILIYANDLSGKPRRLSGHTGPVVSAISSQSGEVTVTYVRNDHPGDSLQLRGRVASHLLNFDMSKAR